MAFSEIADTMEGVAVRGFLRGSFCWPQTAPVDLQSPGTITQERGGGLGHPR